jgi:predicted GTPase
VTGRKPTIKESTVPETTAKKYAQSAEKDTHTLTMEVQDEPRRFRAVCSCGGYVGAWDFTNACMGRGRRHVAAMRRRTSIIPPAKGGA